MTKKWPWAPKKCLGLLYFTLLISCRHCKRPDIFYFSANKHKYLHQAVALSICTAKTFHDFVSNIHTKTCQIVLWHLQWPSIIHLAEYNSLIKALNCSLLTSGWLIIDVGSRQLACITRRYFSKHLSWSFSTMGFNIIKQAIQNIIFWSLETLIDFNNFNSASKNTYFC